MKYREKPVVIEAARFPFTEYPQRISVKFLDEIALVARLDEPCLTIHTGKGLMRAEPGDWVIRRRAGEFYPCKNDIFQATYEAVFEATFEAVE